MGNEQLAVNEITQRLILNTNTVTPILKRMETKGIIKRRRLEEDECKVIVTLTPKGKKLQIEAASIPEKLVAGPNSDHVNAEDLKTLKDMLYQIIDHLSKRQE
jgi:MarR family transcriptional regulator, organic hydroperoxide resistance regulator